jgi:hypothetical protein
MALKTLIICPRSGDYDDFLIDKVNCLMYDENNLEELKKILTKVEKNEAEIQQIVNYAVNNIDNHAFDSRVSSLFTYINESF